ncbi:MAG: Dna2/Cas4 domain-containing protein [Lachnospiraceae bacterium]|nr:Dna2/Cas4 domain-containing protein [Lachnospiraceae bacterium]
MKTDEIAIRTIQHFMYCPHRWGLMEIDKAWAENVFVTKANLLHERVHDPENHYTARGRKVYTSVPVYNDLEQYNLYGVTDCLELIPDRKGVHVNGSEDTYRICIVEYKPTKPQGQDYREEDLMQVFAQKLCVDYVFGGNCDAVIYYANVKKRVPLPLRERFTEYDEKLQSLLCEMRSNLRLGKIPPIRKGQKCSGCSMKDLCMPSLKRMKSLREEIAKIERDAL